MPYIITHKHHRDRHRMTWGLVINNEAFLAYSTTDAGLLSLCLVTRGGGAWMVNTHLGWDRVKRLKKASPSFACKNMVL